MNGTSTPVVADMFGGGNWLFAFLIIAMMFGGGGWFGNRDNDVDAKINAAVNNQTSQLMMQQNLLSSERNNYETARLISEQTMGMMQQNNTNQINLIQGFNALTQTITGQTTALSQAISQLGYQMDSCCCAIKTQMLQDKYDRLYEQYRSVQVDQSNAAQSQYLLNVMGKWVANPTATTT